MRGSRGSVVRGRPHHGGDGGRLDARAFQFDRPPRGGQASCHEQQSRPDGLGGGGTQSARWECRGNRSFQAGLAKSRNRSDFFGRSLLHLAIRRSLGRKETARLGHAEAERGTQTSCQVGACLADVRRIPLGAGPTRSEMRSGQPGASSPSVLPGHDAQRPRGGRGRTRAAAASAEDWVRAAGRPARGVPPTGRLLG